MCVRNVGTVTNAMHKLEAGATLGLRGPYGNGFDMDASRARTCSSSPAAWAWRPRAASSSPSSTSASEFGKVTILYGARSPKELLFTDDLKDWAARPDCEFLVTVDRPDESWKGNTGVITTLFRKIKARPGQHRRRHHRPADHVQVRRAGGAADGPAREPHTLLASSAG